MQTLVTAHLVLEPLHEAHADALFAVLSEPEQHACVDQEPPESLEVLRRGYRRLESRRSPDGREAWLNWALCPRDGDARAVGFVQATVLPEGRAWVAYQLAHALWGPVLDLELRNFIVLPFNIDHAM
jgi:RimJ/RimL family protein N-acetyltransferase